MGNDFVLCRFFPKKFVGKLFQKAPRSWLLPVPSLISLFQVIGKTSTKVESAGNRWSRKKIFSRIKFCATVGGLMTRTATSTSGISFLHCHGDGGEQGARFVRHSFG